MAEWSTSSRLENWRGRGEGGIGRSGGGDGGPSTIHDYARAQHQNGPFPPLYKPIQFGNEYQRFQRGQHNQPRHRTNSFPQRRTLIDTFVERNNSYWETRLTLKIDVPFTDHSHIIGRQGKNTQRVMKETQCHIHFPDSNKSQEAEKSNQVSIAGPPSMVEEARHRIRQLAPLTITFPLKDMRADVDLPSLINHPALETAVKTEDLHVLVRHNRHSKEPFALIRGSVNQEEKIKDAAVSLMQLVFNPGQSVLCSTSLDILQPQQASVKGPENVHVQRISTITGASIHYPDTNRAGATSFFFQGTLDAILKAREMVVGCLPIHVIFELDLDQPASMDLGSLESLHRCSLALRTKKSSDAKTAVLSTLECNLSQAYTFRKTLLAATGPIPSARAKAAAAESGLMCKDYDSMVIYGFVQPHIGRYFPPELVHSHYPPAPVPFQPPPMLHPHHHPSYLPPVSQQTVPPHQMPMQAFPHFPTFHPALVSNLGSHASEDQASIGHPPTILGNSIPDTTTSDVVVNGPVVNEGNCDLPPATPLANRGLIAPHPTPMEPEYKRTPRANLEAELTAAEMAGALSDDGEGTVHLCQSPSSKAPGAGRGQQLRFDYQTAQVEAQKEMRAQAQGTRYPNDRFAGLLCSKTLTAGSLRPALAAARNDQTILGLADLGINEGELEAESTTAVEADDTSGGSSAQLPTWSPKAASSPTPIKASRFAESTMDMGGGLRGGAMALDASRVEAAYKDCQGDLPSILAALDLVRFLPLLEGQEAADLDSFLEMNDEDLKTCGFTFGSRRTANLLQKCLKNLRPSID